MANRTKTLKVGDKAPDFELTGHRNKERFKLSNAQVVGISVDSVPSHVAFARSLGGIEKYPLLADFHPKGEVSKKFGVWNEEIGQCERAIVIVQKKGVVRYIDVHEDSEAPENAQLLEVLRRVGSPSAGDDVRWQRNRTHRRSNRQSRISQESAEGGAGDVHPRHAAR